MANHSRVSTRELSAYEAFSGQWLRKLLIGILLGGSLGLFDSNVVDAGEVCSSGHCSGEFFQCGLDEFGNNCCCPKARSSECCDPLPGEKRQQCCAKDECCRGTPGSRTCIKKVSCSMPRLLPGAPPTRVAVEAQQATNGIGSISVVKKENVTVDIPSFTAGTVEPVTITATKIDEGLRSVVQLSMCTPEQCCLICDPVLVSVIRHSGQPIAETYSDLPQSEGKVTIKNGVPGLAHLRIKVNDKKFEVAGLADDEEITIDISSALVAGNKNTIVLIPLGKPGGSSTVLIHE